MALENDFISLFCKTKVNESNLSNETLLDVPAKENDPIEETKEEKLPTKRKTLKQYTEENTSLTEIMGRIKEDLINSKDITQQTLVSNKEKNLGIVYKSELKGSNKQFAARLMEFNKIPKYLLENLYLELAYYKENKFVGLAPIVGLVCEPTKLYVLTPWYQNSLHQFTYSKERTSQENLRIIK